MCCNESVAFASSRLKAGEQEVMALYLAGVLYL